MLVSPSSYVLQGLSDAIPTSCFASHVASQFASLEPKYFRNRTCTLIQYEIKISGRNIKFRCRNWTYILFWCWILEFGDQLGQMLNLDDLTGRSFPWTLHEFKMLPQYYSEVRATTTFQGLDYRPDCVSIQQKCTVSICLLNWPRSPRNKSYHKRLAHWTCWLATSYSLVFPKPIF